MKKKISNILVYSSEKDNYWLLNEDKPTNEWENFVDAILEPENNESIEFVQLQDEKIGKSIYNDILIFYAPINKDEYKMPWKENAFLGKIFKEKIYTYNNLIVFADRNEVLKTKNKKVKPLNKEDFKKAIDDVLSNLKSGILFSDEKKKDDINPEDIKNKSKLQHIIFDFGMEKIKQDDLQKVDDYYFANCFQKIKQENIFTNVIDYDKLENVQVYYAEHKMIINEKDKTFIVYATPWSKEEILSDDDKIKKYIFKN